MAELGEGGWGGWWGDYSLGNEKILECTLQPAWTEFDVDNDDDARRGGVGVLIGFIQSTFLQYQRKVFKWYFMVWTCALAFYIWLKWKMQRELDEQVIVFWRRARGIHCKLERSETRRVFICYYTLIIQAGHICSRMLLIQPSSSFACYTLIPIGQCGHIC